MKGGGGGGGGGDKRGERGTSKDNLVIMLPDGYIPPWYYYIPDPTRPEQLLLCTRRGSNLIPFLGPPGIRKFIFLLATILRLMIDSKIKQQQKEEEEKK